MRSREARSSREPILGLGLQARVVERDRGGGGDRADELGIVVERRVVDQHRQLAPVALDGRRRTVAAGRGQLDRLSAAVQVGALARHPVRQHQPGIAEHLGQPRLQPHAAQRAELAEEVREPAAREPRAQQAPEQRGRDGEQGRVQDPDERVDGEPATRLVSLAAYSTPQKAAATGSGAARAGAGRDAERQRSAITTATASAATSQEPDGP